jgi:hypothetical protein
VDDIYVYTDIMIRKFSGHEPPIWDTEVEVVDYAGIDPSYTEGGDRFVFTHLKWGRLLSGTWCVAKEKAYILNRDPSSSEDYQYEMIRQVDSLKTKLGIPNNRIGVDASAGGHFWSIGERGSLKGWHAVNFAGPATEMVVSAQYHMRAEDGEPIVAKDLFHNATSELCFVGRYFLETGMLRGLDPDMIREMVQRKYERKNRKIIVESKRDMKQRIGKSPDLWDSFNIGIHVIRIDTGAIAGGAAIAVEAKKERDAWERLEKDLTPESNWNT